MPRLKSLNARQQKFCNLYVFGDTAGNISQSHRKAGYACPTIEGHGANGLRLLKSERIQNEISKLREKSFEKTVLSFNEKRSYLARCVRTSVDQVGSSSDLAQEVSEEVDSSGNVKRKIKVVDKLRALELDNKMSGDNFADRSPQVSNPFTLIIALGKTPAQGQALDDARQAVSVGQLPHPPIVMDAEVVPDDATT